MLLVPWELLGSALNICIQNACYALHVPEAVALIYPNHRLDLNTRLLIRMYPDCYFNHRILNSLTLIQLIQLGVNSHMWWMPNKQIHRDCYNIPLFHDIETTYPAWYLLVRHLYMLMNFWHCVVKMSQSLSSMYMVLNKYILFLHYYLIIFLMLRNANTYNPFQMNKVYALQATLISLCDILLFHLFLVIQFQSKFCIITTTQ